MQSPRCTGKYMCAEANNKTPTPECFPVRIFPFRHVRIRSLSHYAPRHRHCSGREFNIQQSTGSYKATPFFLRLARYSSTPSMSFLPLSYSTTSLSTTHSACFTETSDSTSYTSDGRRDSVYCAEGISSVGGGEDEMRKFLLGPGWVRNSALLSVLIR